MAVMARIVGTNETPYTSAANATEAVAAKEGGVKAAIAAGMIPASSAALSRTRNG